MHRKSTKSNSSKSKKEENDKQVCFKYSIHERNFHVFSYPIILFFDIFRYILYIIIIFLKYFYKCMTKLKLSSTIFSVLKKVQRTSLVRVTPVNTSSVVITECNETNENIDMASAVGDTLLATQKEHHRKAFDFISKALKIDEENTGKFAQNIILCTCTYPPTT